MTISHVTALIGLHFFIGAPKTIQFKYFNQHTLVRRFSRCGITALIMLHTS